MNEGFFRKWLEYFEWNAEEPDTFPWLAREALSEVEMALISKSIATFQLGESSEGHSLLAFARAYGDGMGYAMLTRITHLFVAEEQGHAALLARFMDKHGLSSVSQDWTDDVFRRIRKPFGFEASLSVLITAEILALTYYRALRDATPSRLLKAICNKILEDEKAHVEYESALILNAQQAKGVRTRWAWRHCHQALFAITVVVVYTEHRRVLIKGGYPLVKFVQACWADFSTCFPVSPKARERHLGEPVRG